MNVALENLFSTALVDGLKQRDVENVLNIRRVLVPKYSKKPVNTIYVGFMILLIGTLLGAQIPKDAYLSPWSFFSEFFKNYVFAYDNNCLIGFSGITIELVRPLEDCNFCKDLKEVSDLHTLSNYLRKISSEIFYLVQMFKLIFHSYPCVLH